MCFPARHGPEFILLLHVLEEGDYAAQLLRHRGLNPAGVVMFDKATQSLMEDVPNPHGPRIADNLLRVKLQFTKTHERYAGGLKKLPDVASLIRATPPHVTEHHPFASITSSTFGGDIGKL